MCIICTGKYKELRDITTIKCIDCPNVTIIPHISGVLFIDCRNCPSLTTILQKDLCELYCINCPMLSDITQVQSVYRLTLAICKLIKDVPNIKNLEVLWCVGCPIKKIPAIPTLKTIICYDVPITKIPYTYSLAYISCKHCTSLTSIPLSENLTTVIKECPWISYKNEEEYKRNISNLTSIQKFIQKWMKYNKLKRWLNSVEFSEWYYKPNNPGATKAIQRIYTKI